MLQEVTNKITGTQRPYIYVRAPTDGPYHLLPNLIFFDPIGQLKLDLKCEVQDQRHENAKIVSSKYWTDYSIQTPRLVYGSTRNAYLICRLYKCKVCKSGLIRATYPLFLKQLPQFPVTKPTFIILTFKTDIIKVGLVFSISNFFIASTGKHVG